jgi:hypothetical protein
MEHRLNAGAANGEAVNFQGGLADADRYALSVFAATANAAV